MTVKVNVGELKKLLADQPDDAQVVLKRGSLFIQQETKVLGATRKDVNPTATTESQPAVQ